MTPKEQLSSLRDEMAQVQAATADAQDAGRQDQALELLNRQKSLASSIGNLSGEGIDKKEQIKEGSAELERIGAEAETILQAQRDAAQKAADTQLNSYKDMTTAMNTLAQQITSLNEKAAIELKPEIDKDSLDGAINAVKQAFARVTIPVNVQAVGLPGVNQGPVVQEVTPSRAYGGPLPGSAPHDRADNMLYWGTPGEWVIQRPAARYYGAAFLAALNAMKLPKFALGGQIGASAIDRLRIPSLTSTPAPAGMAYGGNNLTLDFGELGKYHAQASQSTHRELERVFTRAALARGRR